MKQYILTPAAGKRLIGTAVVVHPAVTGSPEQEEAADALLRSVAAEPSFVF